MTKNYSRNVSNAPNQAAFQIKTSQTVTISSWSAWPFFSRVVLWSHFTSGGLAPDRDEAWRSQPVDKSTVNRDFSVAEASFNLKLDLISQMLIVWNCRRVSQGSETTFKHRFPRLQTWSITEDYWGSLKPKALDSRRKEKQIKSKSAAEKNNLSCIAVTKKNLNIILYI